MPLIGPRRHDKWREAFSTVLKFRDSFKHLPPCHETRDNTQKRDNFEDRWHTGPIHGWLPVPPAPPAPPQAGASNSDPPPPTPKRSRASARFVPASTAKHDLACLTTAGSLGATPILGRWKPQLNPNLSEVIYSTAESKIQSQPTNVASKGHIIFLLP